MKRLLFLLLLIPCLVKAQSTNFRPVGTGIPPGTVQVSGTERFSSVIDSVGNFWLGINGAWFRMPTWVQLGSLSDSVNNGLSKVNGVVQLGGSPLVHDTQIDLNAAAINFQDLSVSNPNLFFLSNSQTTFTNVGANSNKAQVSWGVDTFGSNVVLLAGDNNGNNQSISIGVSNQMVIVDQRTNTGLQYGGNYEANFISTSLVDKRYVDSLVSGGGGGSVDTVKGTLNRISISGTTAKPVIDIASTYIGQPSITTVGTLLSGARGFTQATADNSTLLATDAFVQQELTANTLFFGGNFSGLATSVSPLYIYAPTAVKTTNYTLVTGDLAQFNTTSGALTATLPTAPADGTIEGVVITQGTNNLSVVTGGSDVFYYPSSAVTSVTVNGVQTGAKFVYHSGVYYLMDKSGSGGTTTNAVTFNNSNSGAASGTTFNGSAAKTISSNTIGAQAIANQPYIYSANIGMVGDGTTDNKAILQAAINGGSKIIVGKGVYLLSDSVILKNSSFIKGAGDSTIFIVSGNHAVFSVQGSDVSLLDFKIQGDNSSGEFASYTTTSPKQHGVTVSYCGTNPFTNVRLTNITGFNLWGALIYSINNYNLSTGAYENKHITAVNCYAKHCWAGYDFEALGEYNTLSACSANNCAYGYTSAGGNNNIIGGNYDKNMTNIYLRGSSNDGHASAVGATFNHAVDNALNANGLSLGFTFTSCEFFFGHMSFTSTAYINFVNNIIAPDTIKYNNATSIVFKENYFFNSPIISNTGTQTGIQYFNNLWKVGIPSGITENLINPLNVAGAADFKSTVTLNGVAFLPAPTTLGTTSPLTGGGSLSSGLTLSMPAATTSVSGYLTTTDWNTFNNKAAVSGSANYANVQSIAPQTGNVWMGGNIRGGTMSSDGDISTTGAGTSYGGSLVLTKTPGTAQTWRINAASTDGSRGPDGSISWYDNTNATLRMFLTNTGHLAINGGTTERASGANLQVTGTTDLSGTLAVGGNIKANVSGGTAGTDSVLVISGSTVKKISATYYGTGGGSTGANPTALSGLSAVNGTATTFMRSDGAPAIDTTKVISFTRLATNLTGYLKTAATSFGGSALKWTTPRTLSITGDLAYTSPSIDGSGNVTAAGTLATVNSNTGSFGDATHVGSFTVNGKGLITAASSVAITFPISALSLIASGNGSSTTISIAHGLSGVSSSSVATVMSMNTAGAGIRFITLDATNINIVYSVAPASGTNNLQYSVFIKP